LRPPGLIALPLRASINNFSCAEPVSFPLFTVFDTQTADKGQDLLNPLARLSKKCRLNQSARAQTLLNKTAGTVFLGLALKLATAKRYS
jgi:hypothetical protein